MPQKRTHPQLIKLHRTYSIEEAARALRVHKNSVRGWIKSGLSVIDKSRPRLIHGHELRAFLIKRGKAAKCPCPVGTFYCFKCRQPMRPAGAMVECTAHSPTNGNLTALCGACGTIMHRRVRLASIATIMPDLDVQMREAAPRLCERIPPSLNCNERTE